MQGSKNLVFSLNHGFSKKELTLAVVFFQTRELTDL